MTGEANQSSISLAGSVLLVVTQENAHLLEILQSHASERGLGSP